MPTNPVDRVSIPAGTIEESEELISGDRNSLLDMVRIPQ